MSSYIKYLNQELTDNNFYVSVNYYYYLFYFILLLFIFIIILVSHHVYPDNVHIYFFYLGFSHEPQTYIFNSLFDISREMSNEHFKLDVYSFIHFR